MKFIDVFNLMRKEDIEKYWSLRKNFEFLDDIVEEASQNTESEQILIVLKTTMEKMADLIEKTPELVMFNMHCICTGMIIASAMNIATNFNPY